MKYFYEVWVDAEYPYPIYVESEKELSSKEVVEIAKERVIADFEAELLSEDSVLSIDEKKYLSSLRTYEYMDEMYGDDKEYEDEE